VYCTAKLDQRSGRDGEGAACPPLMRDIGRSAAGEGTGREMVVWSSAEDWHSSEVSDGGDWEEPSEKKIGSPMASGSPFLHQVYMRFGFAYRIDPTTA
jgi:hypothetical protein